MPYTQLLTDHIPYSIQELSQDLYIVTQTMKTPYCTIDFPINQKSYSAVDDLDKILQELKQIEIPYRSIDYVPDRPKLSKNSDQDLDQLILELDRVIKYNFHSKIIIPALDPITATQENNQDNEIDIEIDNFTLL